MFQTVDELTVCVLYDAEPLKTKLDLQTSQHEEYLEGQK